MPYYDVNTFNISKANYDMQYWKFSGPYILWKRQKLSGTIFYKKFRGNNFSETNCD